MTETWPAPGREPQTPSDGASADLAGDGGRPRGGDAVVREPPAGRIGDRSPGDLVDVLSRWENSGGHWRILGDADHWLTIGLYSCDGGEEMARVTGARTAALTTYLMGRTESS